jgi:membrane protein
MALRGIDRGTVIAAQSFTALIPLVLLASGLAPADRPDLVSDALIRKLHLGGSAADAVHEVFAHPAARLDRRVQRGAPRLLGGLAGPAAATAVQDAWQLPPRRGVRGSLNAALALAVLLLEFGLLALARTLVKAYRPAGSWARRSPSWGAWCSGRPSRGSFSTGGSPGAG